MIQIIVIMIQVILRASTALFTAATASFLVLLRVFLFFQILEMLLNKLLALALCACGADMRYENRASDLQANIAMNITVNCYTLGQSSSSPFFTSFAFLHSTPSVLTCA